MTDRPYTLTLGRMIILHRWALGLLVVLVASSVTLDVRGQTITGQVLDDEHAGTDPIAGDSTLTPPPRLSLTGYKSVQERPAQDPALTVVLAISGGGHRAANFGAGAMLALEELKESDGRNVRNVLAEVDYLSTASGGGLAAGAYVARFHDHLREKKPADAFRFSEAFYRHSKDDPKSEGYQARNMVRHLERGYNNVLLGNIGLPGESWWAKLKNEVSAAKHWWGQLDRGDRLEASLDARVLTAWEREHPEAGGVAVSPTDSSLVLRDLFVPKGAPQAASLPIWVANTTVYENGAILQYTPDVLTKYGVCEATHRMVKIHPPSTDALPLALGMKASASFPAAVPATTLGVRCGSDGKPTSFLRLIDGGVADNLGVLTSMDIISADGKANPGVRRRVLVVVDAYNGNDQPYSTKEGAPPIFRVAMRMMGISLDSWRGRHRQIIDGLAGKEATVIYLSFDDLRDSKVPADRDLYQQMHAIKTRFDVTKPQQTSLIEGGRRVVAIHRDDILRAIGTPTAPPPGKPAPEK